MIVCPACGTSPEVNDATDAWATCSCRRIIVDRDPGGAVLARTIPCSESRTIIVQGGVLYEFAWTWTCRSTVVLHCGRWIPCRKISEDHAEQRVHDYVSEVTALLVLES